MTDAVSVIKGFEGYIDHAKWDKNAYRAGYGSDTTTLEDGTVVPITSDTVVTREDSERDIARRTADFERTASNQVGSDKWASLPGNVRAALTSTTYNYGSLPHDVVAAAQTGDVNAIANAVRGRSDDNGGINAGRRSQEADIILGGPQSAEDSAPYRPQVSAGVQFSADTEVPLNPNQAVSGTQRVDEPEAPTLWQTEKDAFNQNSTLAMILNSNPYKADPNWVKPDENKLATDLQAADLDPERYAKFLGGSTSQAGYTKAIQDAQADRDRLQRLSQAGFTGTALDFVNQALDPVNVATDLAVSAVAPELTLGKYGVRVGRVLSAALAGGASGLATSAVNYGFNPNATKADLMMGTVIGAGLGGIVGSLGRSTATAAEARGFKQIGEQVIAQHEGVPYVPPARGAMGAAPAPTRGSFLDDDNPLQMLEHSDTPQSAFRAGRVDMRAMVDKSQNPAARKTAEGMLNEGTGVIGPNINGRSADEDQAMLQQEFSAAFNRTYRPQKQAFIANGGTEREFNEQVFKYIEDTRLNKSDFYAKEVKVAGDNTARVFRETLELQKNPLVREGGVGRPVQGADKTPANENYIPHEWHNEKVHLGDEYFEDGTLHNLIKGGMRRSNAKLDEPQLDRLAGAFLKSIKERGAGVGRRDFLTRVSGNNMEDAIQSLVETGSLTQSEADNFIKNYEADNLKAGSDTGNAKPFKRRSLIDPEYVLPYRPRVRKTGEVHDADISVKDFLNQNTEYLAQKYIRRASGNIAMARMKLAIADTKDEAGEVVAHGATILDGITSDKEWAKHLDDIARKGADAGQTPRQIKADRDRLQYAYDMIKGTKTYDFDATNPGWALRMFRKFNFIRMMNQVGLAQLPELGNLVGSVGIKAMAQQLPDMRRIIGADGVSHLRNGFGDDVEAIFGAGTESWHRTPNEQYDEMLNTVANGRGHWQDRVSTLLDKGQRITGKISGMEGIDTLSKRWAYKAVIQKFANAAAGKAKLPTSRLADLGLDKDMFERIKVALRDPKSVQMNGSRVAGLKLDNWKDKEAAEAFRRAVYRKSTEIIQQNQLGNSIKWMGHPVAKALTQFRTFMAASYVKQSLKLLHQRDPEALINAALASFIGAMVYEVQTREQALGRSDADKFLQDRLSPAKLATAGFAKAGVSSILPMLIDSTIPMAGYKPLFSYSRTTGQTSSILTGNPTGGLMDDVPNAINAGRGLIHGDMSQEEARTLWKLMPFGNAFGALQGFNYAISGLNPRTPQSRKRAVGLFGDDN
ncbi:hypothetical protein [Rhizobium sp. BK376]|uniref:hypothetical protein n=1 Tax=Rhizobium sp. BK376 TaxID=2512149 RepID=UPI00104FE3C3|nr:hypothetical protein [Rhizobium sp. BK376]TCR92574.1 GH24 family phage-related lysozyme (muramidase) [Rhizobium sp. BK376]